MALPATFTQLIRTLEHWREAMEHLQLTVREDCPQERAMTDPLNDAISDQLGWIAEALECTRMAATELPREENLRRVRAQISKTQRLVNQAIVGQGEHLTGCEQFRLLGDVEEREQGRPWKDWVRTVEASLAAFPRLLYAVMEAERECWEALCDSLGNPMVSVRNVSVGQQFFRENGSNREGVGENGGAASEIWATEPQT